MLNRLEVDQAVFFAIATRAWQFLAGPLSILVIAACFTPELQGYYYTFATLMGMQSLFELGLHCVIINVSSHEWSQLRLSPEGTIVGAATAIQRLSGLKHFVARWYAIVAIAFVVGCGIGGGLFLYLNQRPSDGVAWAAPWFCLVTLNSLLLWAWAYSAMLEGCNQTIVVNRVRMFQFVTGSFVVWGSMALGLGLWATVLSVAVRLAWDYWLIFVRYRRFWMSLHLDSGESLISWEQEIWPLQWRLAVQGIAGFFAYSLFTLVMFSAHGPVVAGKMGMTWQVLTAIESACFAWIQVRAPLFGMIAARRDWREMDRVYDRLVVITSSFYLTCIVGMCVCVWGFNELPYDLTKRLAGRMLGVGPTIVFAIAFLLLHLPRCQVIYIRAHKKEPFLLASIVSSGLIATLVVFLGRAYGPLGAAWGFLIVAGTVNLPWWYLIWRDSRIKWHHEENAIPHSAIDQTR